MPGVPGRLTPVNWRTTPFRSGARSTTRYQIFGSDRPRCISLATIARPSKLALRLIAQLLLPIIEVSKPDALGSSSAVRSGAARSQSGAGGGVGAAVLVDAASGA